MINHVGDGFKFVTVVLVAAIALLCIGCTEGRNTARFIGVDYVSCQKTKTIRNPDCFAPDPAGDARLEANCKASPTVLACAEWLVVGGVSDCGIALNCKPTGTEE